MEENIMKKLIALSGLFILVLAFSGCSFQGEIKPPVQENQKNNEAVSKCEQKIYFIYPERNNRIKGELTADGQVSVNFQVQTKCPLEKEEKISLFVQVTGGDKWWASGNQATQFTMKNNIAYFGYTTFGTPSDKNKKYTVSVGITKQIVKSGETFVDLPKDIETRDTLTVDKENEFLTAQ